MFEDKTFSQIENSKNEYTLKLSELKLYFLYKALEFMKINSIIESPFAELMNDVEQAVKESSKGESYNENEKS